VQSVMAADTGSADDSAQLVTDALGADRVLHLARRTGFGQAVEEANRNRAAADPGRPAVPEAPQRLGPRHAHVARRRLRPCRNSRTASPSSGCGCCTTTPPRSRTRWRNCCGSWTRSTNWAATTWPS